MLLVSAVMTRLLLLVIVKYLMVEPSPCPLQGNAGDIGQLSAKGDQALEFARCADVK